MKMTQVSRRPSEMIHVKPSTFLMILVILQITPSEQHGRLIEPPSRASAWRYGFSTPANYNDHELFCGGFTRQHATNKGKCGECGDAWDLPTPRPHEYGGKYGQGVTVRKYNPGSPVTIRVELTASHMGYFEFRLCDDINARQTCLDKNILQIISGTPFVAHSTDLDTRFYPRNGSRIYEIKAQLPKKFECQHCVLQWKYVAGNNWGICADGNGAVGCGAQEEFRACSDIAIGKGSASAIPTIKPPTKVKPSTDKWPTGVQENEIDIDHDHDENGSETNEDVQKPPTTTPNLFGAIIAIFTFFLVLCAFVAIYIYFYHGDLLKRILRRQHSHQTTPLQSDTSSTISSSPSLLVIQAPVRPPRTKRLSQTLKDVHNDHTIITTSHDKDTSEA